MRNKSGQFDKGYTYREPKPYWNRDWLIHEYIDMSKSASQVSKEQGCCENNILFWIHKHGIKARTISETRKVKYWGSVGVDNPMWNQRGELNPRWLGGITPERQSFYTSEEWKRACSLVWKRDNATCQRCKQPKKTDMPFHIHHLKSFADKELRADIDNLVLLCESCHQWVHSKGNIRHDYLQ
jgi:hypothetical protein